MRLALSLVFLTIVVSAQNPASIHDPTLIQAKDLYNQGKFMDAIPILENCITLNPNDPDAAYYLAASYRATRLYDKAISQYERLEQIKPDYWVGFRFEKGMILFEMKQYDLVIPELQEFIEKFPRDAFNIRYIHQAEYRLNYCRKQKELNEMVPKVKEPEKLSTLVVNSKYPDYMPAMDPTGNKLYFTSKRRGGIKDETPDASVGDEDLYFIEKTGSDWGAPQLLPEPINSPSNEGAACFSADGQLMIYTACSKPGGVGNCDLYIATLEGNKWTKPTNMGNIVNSEQWESQPSISFDGNRIIFSSNRPGGYGSEDLYMIERNSFGEWGPSMNLGGTVNTPYSDISPFLSQDGKTLYFASQGHPGYGGYDMFMTVFDNSKWSEPVNLGKPLNTSGDDAYFTIGGSGEVGYFSSNRDGTQEDLYSVAIPEEMRPQATVVVEGTVTDSKTNKPVGAYVLVEDLNTGEMIAINKSNSATGKYLTVLPSGKVYSVSANKEGYFFHSERFDVPKTTKYKEISKNIALRPIEKGAKVVLNNIFFETGKATLSAQSRLDLKKAIELMNDNPSMTIEVGGHTDNVSDDAYNMKLSLERARSVREYMIAAGVAASRLQARGYGELSPIETNNTEDGRRANRRTEFTILEFR